MINHFCRKCKNSHGPLVYTERQLLPEYRVWYSMIQRCTNPRNPWYRRYGERGITVCGEWRRDFEAFLAHVGPRPGPEYSIDRIDNDGNYEPGNVRWATSREQRANQRRPRRASQSLPE